MNDKVTQLLGSMDAKQLKALARQAMRQAEKKKEPVVISPNHEVLAPIAEAILEANKTLRIKSVETIDLVLRRMKLGHSLVRAPRYAQAKKTDGAGQNSSAE